MHILIVKMSAIGDVIHTLPALNALREHLPEAHITWLVEEAAAGIVESHEALDRVLISKRGSWTKGLLGLSCLENMKEIGRFVKALRDTKYDLVIDFQGLFKSAIMVTLCRARRKVGYDKTREGSYMALSDRLPPFDMDKHAIFRYLNLTGYLGVKTGQIRFDIPFGEKERSDIRSMLRKNGWEKESIVCINPVAKWETKLWKAEGFSQLTQKLVQKLGCYVVFTGNKADEESVTQIIPRRHPGWVNFCGLTDLTHLAALYEMARCLVCTDTGPMHLAAAVGTPVVALFGPTAPWRTGPFGKGHKVLRADLPCSPCFKKKCDSSACMGHISVAQAFDAVQRIVSR